MAVPATKQRFPQRVRQTFSMSKGLHLPDKQSVQTSGSQGPPINPVYQVQYIGSGNGSVILGPAQIVSASNTSLYVPLVGIPTPFSPSTLVTFTVNAPIIQLPPGISLGSVLANPYIRSTLKGGALPATIIGPGVTVSQFLVMVVFSISAIPSSGVITINVSGNITV